MEATPSSWCYLPCRQTGLAHCVMQYSVTAAVHDLVDLTPTKNCDALLECLVVDLLEGESNGQPYIRRRMVQMMTRGW